MHSYTEGDELFVAQLIVLILVVMDDALVHI